MKLVPHKVGLVVGAFFGIVHAIWAAVVALGFAQTFMNWIYSLHFLNNPFVVAPFDIGVAITLVIVTFIVGYILGQIFTSVWNYLLKQK